MSSREESPIDYNPAKAARVERWLLATADEASDIERTIRFTEDEKEAIDRVIRKPLPDLDAPEAAWHQHWESQADAWETVMWQQKFNQMARLTSLRCLAVRDERLAPLIKEHPQVGRWWSSLCLKHRGTTGEAGEVTGQVNTPPQLPTLTTSSVPSIGRHPHSTSPTPPGSPMQVDTPPAASGSPVSGPTSSAQRPEEAVDMDLDW